MNFLFLTLLIFKFDLVVFIFSKQRATSLLLLNSPFIFPDQMIKITL